MAVADKITYTSTDEQVESMHNAFDSALEELRGNLGQTYPLLIGGEERAGGDTFEVRSPADNQIVIGRFAAGTPTSACTSPSRLGIGDSAAPSSHPPGRDAGSLSERWYPVEARTQDEAWKRTTRPPDAVHLMSTPS